MTFRPLSLRPPRSHSRPVLVRRGARPLLALLAGLLLFGVRMLPSGARAEAPEEGQFPVGADGAILRQPVQVPPPVPTAPAGATPTGTAVTAATPPLILYQGRLSDEGGAPRGGPVNLIVSLYAEPTGGTPLWNEAHIGVPLSDGIFSVLLGSVNAFPFTAFNTAERYLSLSVDGQPEMVPRLRLASVPYAFESERVGGKRATDFEPLGQSALAAAGVQAQLQGSDANPPNQGSNQVHWNNLWGVPNGFSDGTDDIGTGVNVHSQLQGLGANDHPQYILGEVLQITDGNAPNLGSNRVHWDNLGGVPQPLADQVLPRNWIQASSLDSTRVATGGLAGRNLKPGTVTADRLAPGAVGSAQIADGSLPGTKLQPGTLTSTQVQNGSLTGVDLQDESIQTNDIANGTLIGVDFSPGSVTSLTIQDGTVSGVDIADGSLTGADLADSTLGGPALKAGAVGARELGANAVTSVSVQDSSLAAIDLKDGAGVAFRNIPGFVDTVETQAAKVITTLVVNAPGPGWISVRAGCQVSFVHDLGRQSLVTLGVGLSSVLADTAAATLVLPGPFPSEIYQFPLAVDAVFEVDSPGPRTVHVLAAKGIQARIPSLNHLRVQAQYFPRRY